MNAPHPVVFTAQSVIALLALAASCAAPSVVSQHEPQEAPIASESPATLDHAAQAEANPAAVPASKTLAKPRPLSAWLKSSYRLRTAGGDSDQDLYELLGIDYEDPAKPQFAAHFLGRAAVDLDGDSGLLFNSINDVGPTAVDADVFEGYVDWGSKSGDTRVRVGRQSDYLTPAVVHFDGVSMRARTDGERPVELGIGGGRNVTYDSSTNDDDTVLNTYLESRAWTGGRVRVDWMHLNDSELLGDDENDLVGLGLWQSWKGWSFNGKYTRLEDHNRDLELRARWSAVDGKTSLQMRYFELLEAQNQRALFLDPFTQSLQTYYPFQQFGANVWRALSEKIDLDVGVDFRQVDDSGDVGTYNHDWQRYYSTLTLHELIARAWTVSATFDYYDDDQSDFTTYSGEISREFNDDFRLSAGSYYSLYKYDFYSSSEQDDVRSYFARLSWRRNATWTFDLGYEYEDDDTEQYNTVRLGALCRF